MRQSPLRECKVQLNRAAETLFEDRRFTLLSQSKVIEIADVSVAELGFTQGATYDVLVEHARRMGLIAARRRRSVVEMSSLAPETPIDLRW